MNSNNFRHHPQSIKRHMLRYLLFLLRIMWRSCVELTHSSLGDGEDIFVTHLVIIIKSEVSTFFMIIYLTCLYHHMRCMSIYVRMNLWYGFVGHSCPGGFCPASCFLSLTWCSTTLLGTLLTYNTWQICFHIYSFPWSIIIIIIIIILLLLLLSLSLSLSSSLFLLLLLSLLLSL